MKTVILSIALAVLSLGFLAARAIDAEVAEVLKKLDIPVPKANESIWSSFSGRYFYCPKPSEMKKVALGERAAIVRQVGEYARQYAGSQEFLKSYTEYRENQKPAPPEPPKSAAQMKQEQKEQLQKNIKETEKNMQTATADGKKIMKQVLASLQEQLKSVDDPQNPMFSPQMDAMMKQGYDMQMNEYNQRLAKWEKDLPPTPTLMVKNWLQEFLDVSKDVDFNAKLVKGEGKFMVFANPEYENKPENWKKCFRAGKETVGAGRAFAAEWLKALDSAK